MQDYRQFGDPGKVRTGIEGFRRQLLDLSDRNPLVDIGRGQKNVPFFLGEEGAGLPALESLLAGQNLRPRDLGLEAGGLEGLREETGGLFLTLGLLDYEAGVGSGMWRRAPLLLYGLRAVEGGLAPADGGIMVNPILAEKLARFAGVVLPDFAVKERPGAWMERVEREIDHLEGWTLNSQATGIGRFVPRRFFLWKDLDAWAWPESADLAGHEMVQALADTPPAESIATPVRPFELTGGETRHFTQPFAWYGAADEMSILLEALEGTDLLIGGEDGARQGRLLANLALARAGAGAGTGATVLYLVRDNARLVRMRAWLEESGLAPYCLDMTGAQGGARPLRRQLKTRLARIGKVRAPRQLKAVGRELERLAGRLEAYDEAIDRPFGRIGMTVSEIFAAAAWHRMGLGRYRELLRTLAEPDAAGLTEADIESREALLERWARGYGVLAESRRGGEALPWEVLGSRALEAGDADRLIETVREWREATGRLQAAFAALARLLDTQITADPHQAADLAPKLEFLKAWPAGEMDWALFARLADPADRTEIEQFLAEFTHWQQAVSEHERELARERARRPDLGSLDEADRPRLREALAQMADWAEGDSTLDALFGLSDHLGFLASQGALLQLWVKDMRRLMKVDLPTSLTGAKAAYDYIDLALNQPQRHQADRAEIFERDNLLEEIDPVRERAEALREARRELGKRFLFGEMEGPGAIRALAADLRRGGGAGRWLDKEWRQARSRFRAARKDSDPPDEPEEMAAEMERVADFLEAEAAFQEDEEGQRVLGPLFFGSRTDFEGLVEMRGWYEAVQTRFTPLGRLEHKAIQSVLGADSLRLEELRHLDTDEFVEIMQMCLEALSELERIAPSLSRDVRDLELERLGELPERLGSAPATARGMIEAAGIAGTIRLRDLIAELDRRAETEEAGPPGFEPDPRIPELLGTRYGEAATETGPIRQILDRRAELAAALDQGLPGPVAAYLDSLDSARALADLLDRAEELAKARQAWMTSRETALDVLALDPRAWEGEAPDRTDLDALAGHLDAALAARDRLGPWLDYLGLKRELEKAGLEGYVALAEQDQAPAEMLPRLYRAVAFRALARAAMQSDKALARFRGWQHAEELEKYAETSNRLLDSYRQALAHRFEERALAARDGAGQALERYFKAATENPEAPADPSELCRLGGRTLQAFTPVILATPESVATHMPPGRMSFDMVIIDGGDRIRLGEALGAIARADQVVVTGPVARTDLPPLAIGPEQGSGEGPAREITDRLGDSVTRIMAGFDDEPRALRARAEEAERHAEATAESYFVAGLMRALSQRGYKCETARVEAGQIMDVVVRDPGSGKALRLAVQGDGPGRRCHGNLRERRYLARQDAAEAGWEIVPIFASDWLRQPAREIEHVLRRIEARLGERDKIEA